MKDKILKILLIVSITLISVAGLSNDTKSIVEHKYHESCGLPPWVGKKINKNKDPKSFSAYWYKSHSWKTGQTINVYFKNGTKEQKAITKFYAMEWARYGNFKLNFKRGSKTTNEEAVVVEFTAALAKKGICGLSSVGGGSTKISAPSLQLDVSCVESGTILHEFGHTLGFNHEQDNPSGNHQYNMNEYYKYYGAKGYSKADLDKWRKSYQDKEYYDWSAFDRYSVMAYSLPGKLFKDGRAFGGADHLSEGDKEAIRRIFPGKALTEDTRNNYLFIGKGKMKVDVSLKRAEASIYVNNKLVKTLKDPEQNSYGLRTYVDISAFMKTGYGKNIIRIESKRKDANAEVFFWFMENSKSPKFYRGYDSFSCFGQKQCGWDPNSLNHTIAFNFYKLNPEDYYTRGNENNTDPDPVKPEVTTIKNADDWSGTYICEENDVLKIIASEDGSVKGTFSDGKGNLNGQISLEKQNLLQGKWVLGNDDKNKGFFYFYLQEDGKINGHWAYLKDKKWRSSWQCQKGKKKYNHNKRKEELLKKIKQWAKTFDCGEESGPLKLKIKNAALKQLTGTFGENYDGVLNGTLEGENLDQFKGEWYYPNSGSKGDFIFYRQNGKLVGYWKYSGDTEWKKDDWTCR